MKNSVVAAAVALTLGSTLFVAAQQPAPPAPGAPAAAPGGRGGGRGFGPPGGGPETGLNTRPENAPDQKPAFPGQHRVPEQKLNVAFDVVTVTEGLVNPWGMTFLPDGKILVTEKPGRLRVVSADGKTMSEPVAGLPMTDTRGQGGLLDVAIDPAFQKNQLIYWSYAEPRENMMNNTAVEEVRASGLPVITLNMAGSVPDAADLVVSDPVHAGVMAVMAVADTAKFDLMRQLKRRY